MSHIPKSQPPSAIAFKIASVVLENFLPIYLQLHNFVGRVNSVAAVVEFSSMKRKNGDINMWIKVEWKIFATFYACSPSADTKIRRKADFGNGGY